MAKPVENEEKNSHKVKQGISLQLSYDEKQGLQELEMWQFNLGVLSSVCECVQKSTSLFVTDVQAFEMGWGTGFVSG